jgi:riboflavin kinase/FMN adenylyltransferase
LEGKVVQGDQRGRTMGFPTANLLLEQPFMTPRRGVYVVKAQLDDEEVAGIMNIGIRPTFHDPTPHEQLEVHLFNREVDLYGKTLRIQILHYLREEQKFPSVDVLIKQIEMDKSQALTWLATFIE